MKPFGSLSKYRWYISARCIFFFHYTYGRGHGFIFVTILNCTIIIAIFIQSCNPVDITARCTYRNSSTAISLPVIWSFVYSVLSRLLSNIIMLIALFHVYLSWRLSHRSLPDPCSWKSFILLSSHASTMSDNAFSFFCFCCSAFQNTYHSLPFTCCCSPQRPQMEIFTICTVEYWYFNFRSSLNHVVQYFVLSILGPISFKVLRLSQKIWRYHKTIIQRGKPRVPFPSQRVTCQSLIWSMW